MHHWLINSDYMAAAPWLAGVGFGSESPGVNGYGTALRAMQSS